MSISTFKIKQCKLAPTMTLLCTHNSVCTQVLNLLSPMISETKLDDSFLSAQFLLNGFSKPYRLDRCLNGSGILLYILDDIPSCLLSNSNKTESIFVEINFRKKKWLICTCYNPLKSNISNHLHHLGKGLDNYVGNYDNILLLGIFNSEFLETCFNDFCDVYNLKILCNPSLHSQALEFCAYRMLSFDL